MRTFAACTAAALLAASNSLWAALPWAPEPEQTPEVSVDDGSIVITLSWDYPNHCFEGVGFNWIRPGAPTMTGPRAFSWDLNYGFFGGTRRCPVEGGNRYVGRQQYRWQYLSPGTYSVKIAYVDASSYMDCSLVPGGCPVPTITRTFAFDVVVPPRTVPATPALAVAMLVTIIGTIGAVASRRRRLTWPGVSESRRA